MLFHIVGSCQPDINIFHWIKLLSTQHPSHGFLKGTPLHSAQRPLQGTLKTPFFSQASVTWILKGTLLLSSQCASHGTFFLAKRPLHGFLKGHSFFQPNARHMEHWSHSFFSPVCVSLTWILKGPRPTTGFLKRHSFFHPSVRHMNSWKESSSF
jgi:hypothetical protein